MIEQNAEGLRKVRRALLSVSDKTGIVELARELRGFGVEIISTGGTATALREAGVEVMEISDVTGFPEMMDGRVKTLHPRIHGALLALRDNAAHVAAMSEHGIEPIDLVVVNLYPFEQTIAREGVTLEEAVEQIDIGGPSMIRSAAKNWRDVAVIVMPQFYAATIDEMRRNDGALSLATRMKMALQAFQRTAIYDAMISSHLTLALEQEGLITKGNRVGGLRGGIGTSSGGGPVGHDDFIGPVEQLQSPPDFARFTLKKARDLRYGENPHQSAALYHTGAEGGVANAELLGGKEMSFNNYVDADAAWQLVCDFDELACAIIKHTNPAGVALGQSPEEAYRRALATDPVSAFGGIVAFNRPLDEAAARVLTEIFTEVVIAPEFSEAAFAVLRAKKNLRILRMGQPRRASGLEYRQITGGMLVQSRDMHVLMRDKLKVATRRAPGEEELRALLFAWIVCKHTKSNAIVYARDGQTVGVGAGQMSRIDSVKLGAMRAHLPVKNSVIASDAFFPFRDGVDEAARQDITAVIQPGGSLRDEEVIAAADEHNLAMVFTGIRHFKH
jgi:phosphoribosylaminoimidazolecarboxamide formyltransferase/IMP cyclohydrolase